MGDSGADFDSVFSEWWSDDLAQLQIDFRLPRTVDSVPQPVDAVLRTGRIAGTFENRAHYEGASLFESFSKKLQLPVVGYATVHITVGGRFFPVDIWVINTGYIVTFFSGEDPESVATVTAARIEKAADLQARFGSVHHYMELKVRLAALMRKARTAAEVDAIDLGTL